MLPHNILYVLETDVSLSSQMVHIWLQINFPFIQLLVPKLQLSFERSYLPIYISKCSKAATQHRCLVLDFFVMSARKATYNKHFIISEYWNQRAVLSLKYFLPIYVMLKFAQELSLTVNTLHQNAIMNVHIRKQSQKRIWINILQLFTFSLIQYYPPLGLWCRAYIPGACFWSKIFCIQEEVKCFKIENISLLSNKI